MEVARRDSVVGSLVVVIIIGQNHFAAFERLVIHSECQTKRELAAKLFQFITDLGVEVHRLVETDAFLPENDPGPDSFVENLERRVGRDEKTLWGVGNTDPLETGAAADFDIVGLADSRGVVVSRDDVILCELGVTLSVTGRADSRHGHQ